MRDILRAARPFAAVGAAVADAVLGFAARCNPYVNTQKRTVVITQLPDKKNAGSIDTTSPRQFVASTTNASRQQTPDTAGLRAIYCPWLGLW